MLDHGPPGDMRWRGRESLHLWLPPISGLVGDHVLMEEQSGQNQERPSLGSIYTAMGSMMNSLHRWKSKKFPSVPRELEKLRKQLDELSQLTDEDSTARRRKLTAEMDEMLYREELMWLQRSRVDSLRAGDRNTKYFHRKASRWQQKNIVRKLKRPDGTVTNDVRST
jgi:hypothetical protein